MDAEKVLSKAHKVAIESNGLSMAYKIVSMLAAVIVIINALSNTKGDGSLILVAICIFIQGFLVANVLSALSSILDLMVLNKK